MNDPNGTIYYGGYYHLFYQHNPNKDTWGNLHWGHARSVDLINWEHLPIALSPDEEHGETSCYSGSCVINEEGTPMIFYTRVGIKPERHPRDQWTATSDQNMINWQRHTERIAFYHGDDRYEAYVKNWRDPFLFSEKGRMFLIIAAQLTEKLNEDYAVLLYEAMDESLLSWKFRNTLMTKPSYELSFLECPNFFKIEDQWVLIVSPYKPVEYYIGTFDTATCTFKPTNSGYIDHGIDYYATQVLKGPDNRTILFSWIRGFQKGRGWNGCLALPREVALENGRLVTRPIKEIRTLRKEPIVVENKILDTVPLIIEHDEELNTFELQCELTIEESSSIDMRLLRTNEHSDFYIKFDGHSIDICGNKVQLDFVAWQSTINLDIFVDCTVIEVFIDGGSINSTKVIYPKGSATSISIKSVTAASHLRYLRLWPLEGLHFKDYQELL